MKLIDFLQEIKLNCSEITYLSMNHMFDKLYIIDNDIIDKDKLLQNIQDYPSMLRYLNDYAGTIYRQYNSSTQEIYDELCQYFKLDKDNIYTFRQTLNKLQKQTPDMIMSIEDKDIKIQTINNFENKLQQIKQSNYYINQIEELKEDILILEKNISLVKKASLL